MSRPVAVTAEEVPRNTPRRPRGRGIKIGFITNSATIMQPTVVITSDLEQYVEMHGISGLRSAKNYVVSEDIKRLFEAIAEEGGVDERGVLLRNKVTMAGPAIREALKDIRPDVSDFVRDAMAVIAVPEEGDFAEMLTALPPRIMTVGPGVINPDTGRVTKKPRSIMNILREYRLNDGTPPQLPYVNFTMNLPGEYSENCLTNALIKRYDADQPREKNKISRRMISRFCGDEPTAETLIAFGRKYKLRLSIHDLTGRVLYTNTASDGGYEHSNRRPAFVAIVYGNHIYPYDGSMRGRIDLEVCSDTDLIEYMDSRIRDDMTEEEAAFAHFMQMKVPNFLFKAEDRLVLQGLMWVNRMEYEEFAAGTCYDMTKAYDTVITRMVDDNEKIPAFSVMDVIEAYNKVIDEVHDHSYYFVKQETLERWRSSTNPHLKARVSKLLAGYEVNYYLSKDYMTTSDIEFKKEPTNTFRAKLFKNALLSVPLGEEDRGSLFSHKFNGVLGMHESSGKMISFLTDLEDDIELIISERSDGDYELLDTVDSELKKLKLKLRDRNYLYFNARNMYNFTVSRTNLEMCKFIDQMTDGGAQVYKVKIDGVMFDREVDLGDWEEYFHVEEDPAYIKYVFEEVRIDAAEMRENTLTELNAWAANVEVITGPPGTGKTYKAQHDYSYDCAYSPTNVCARNMDTETVKADTLFKGLSLYKFDEFLGAVLCRMKGKTVWVDEFSMCPPWIWGCLYMVGLRSELLLLTGDPNQCPPIDEELPYECPFFECLLAKKTHLTTEHRNDPKLVAVRDYIIDNNERNIRKKMYELSVDDDTRATEEKIQAADWHICYTNNMRRLINQYMLEARGKTYGFVRDLVRHARNPDVTQEKFKKSHHVYRWTVDAGIPLVARRTIKNLDIYKGARYMLMSDVSEESSEFVLRRITAVDEEDRVDVTYPINKLILFDVGYAITAHSSQGLTIKEPAVIHEVSKMLHRDKRILYTAVTRLRSLEDLSIVYSTAECMRGLEATLPEIPDIARGIKEEYMTIATCFHEDDDEAAGAAEAAEE